MQLIDTHTHLYLDRFDDDREQVIGRAMERGVERFYLPNIDSGSIDAMLQMEVNFPDQCFAMMGLHPCSVQANFREELATVERYLTERPFAAIGEIGIDLYWDDTFYKEQREAFSRQITWAKDLNLPIVIHSRNSTEIVIDMLREHKDKRLRGIFHCFSGTREEGQAIIEQGFLLGIGGIVTFKNGGLDKVVQELPIEHMVLETDSPYLAPVPNRGKRNESAFVRDVAKRIAEVKEISLEEVARITSANALEVFVHRQEA